MTKYIISISLPFIMLSIALYVNSSKIKAKPLEEMRSRSLKVYVTNGNSGLPVANAVYVKPGVAITNAHVCDLAVLLDVKAEDPELGGASWAAVFNKLPAAVPRDLDACFIYFSPTALPELPSLEAAPLDPTLPIYRSGFTYNSKISFTVSEDFGYALTRGFIASSAPRATILDFDTIRGDSGSGVYQIINGQAVLVSLIEARIVSSSKGVILNNKRFLEFYEENLK